jgi:hypothetical protein
MIGKELKYGFWVLRQSPLFSAFAILSLTLGIAANLAIFSIVNGVLLKPLAFPAPERLFGIVEIISKMGRLIQAPDAQEGHDHVALLTYSLWRGQVAGDATIVGRDVRINGSPHQKAARSNRLILHRA